jgi:signal transduction histidine kinase
MSTAPATYWPDRVSFVAGAFAVLLAGGVLLGWAMGSELLISFNMRFIAMLPVTAVAIMACGLALVLLQPRVVNDRNVKIARVLASFAFLIGIASFVSRMADRDLFWLGLLFYESLTHFPYRPIGVMAINTTIVLMLTSTGLLMVASRSERTRRFGRVLALFGAGITAVALLGHLYGASALYAFDRFAGMALITAMGLAAVQVGLIFLRSEDEGISLLTGPDLAGIVMRRMLPLAIVFPVLAGMALISGREREIFGRETGAALVTVTVSIWMMLLLIYNARFIRAADSDRAALLESEHNARRVAESASKAKSDFLAVMSHELRTPLNAIVGYTGILREEIEGPLNANQERHLRRIGESAEHLVRLVNDILMLTRVESGRVDTKIELVVIHKLLDDVGGIIEPLARAKGLEFRCHADASLTVMSDAHLLRQILINLGGNAVKFTHSGVVSFSAVCAGDMVRIDVRDTGIGIAPGDFEKIFDEFWQVEPALTRNTGGAGLGLAVSRHLARQLGGQIRLESAVGQGSTFSLSIPGHAAASPTST